MSGQRGLAKVDIPAKEGETESVEQDNLDQELFRAVEFANIAGGEGAADAACAAKIDYWLRQGASPSALGKLSGKSALMEALGRGFNLTAKALLVAGADACSRCPSGDSAFSWAAIRGMEAWLKELAPLSDVNQRASTGETPLMQALRYSSKINENHEAVKFLLSISDLSLGVELNGGGVEPLTLSLAEYAKIYCSDPENVALVDHAVGRMRTQEEAAAIEKTLGVDQRRARTRSL